MKLWATGKSANLHQPVISRLTGIPLGQSDRAGNTALVTSETEALFGDDFTSYDAVMFKFETTRSPSMPTVIVPPSLEYLGSEDVVHLFPNGMIQVLYRRQSLYNTILATERCNSFCLMCSQPPREVDDAYRVHDILRLIELISPETFEIGISGGEPTLLGDGLIRIVQQAKDLLPSTALHILTNGRNFKDAEFAKEFGAVAHPDLMLGIPLYSDIDWKHDYVVQASGAFDETLEGLFNLARSGVRIEVRVVLHQQTVGRLPELANFIARNLPFVQHVALMGLEMFGFTTKNLDVLWIDPVDYSGQLVEAVKTLAFAGMRPVIYNHQLCTIPRELWPFAVKSISDWKNVYLPECEGCEMRSECGGFFQSATKRHSRAICAIRLTHGDSHSAIG